MSTRTRTDLSFGVEVVTWAEADWLLVAAMLFGLLIMIRVRRERSRVNRNRLWILSLDQAQLLALLLRRDIGFDKQDCDGLVQLAYQSYPEGGKDAIVQRIAEHLTEIVTNW